MGAALEMLHTYSLIHDDLPALDNDDLRRGRPDLPQSLRRSHRDSGRRCVADAGLRSAGPDPCPAEARVAIIREVAHATGTIDGMIGGQVVDLEAEHKKPDLGHAGIHSPFQDRRADYRQRGQRRIVRRRQAPARCADVACGRYGQSIGLAFQIVDDVLDVTQTSEQLGKTAGKDKAAEKATYPALFGINESIRKADALVDQACAELNKYG